MSDRIIVAWFSIHPDAKVFCGSCGRWVVDLGKLEGGRESARNSIEQHIANCPHLNQMRRDLEPFVITVEKP